MSIDWRKLLIPLLFILLIGLLWRSPSAPFKDLLGEPKEAPKQYPIAYMTDVKTTQFDEQGAVSYRLIAKRFLHFEGEGKTSREREANGFSTLTKPIMTLYNESSLPWKASADSGVSTDNGNEITLEGNVVLWQENTQGITSKVNTTKLLIKPKLQYAETDKPVMINDLTGTTNAIGAKVYLPDSKIELLSEVRGIYDAR